MLVYVTMDPAQAHRVTPLSHHRKKKPVTKRKSPPEKEIPKLVDFSRKIPHNTNGPPRVAINTIETTTMTPLDNEMKEALVKGLQMHYIAGRRLGESHELAKERLKEVLRQMSMSEESVDRLAESITGAFASSSETPSFY